MQCRTLIVGVLLLAGWPVLAQFGSGDQEYVNEVLGVDQDFVDRLIQTGDSGGEQSRWATLAEKALKYDLTVRQAEAKRRERDLQREQLGKLADGLRRTGELFRNYYEKYQLISGAVQTVAGFLKIGRRVRSILDLLDRLRPQLVSMDQFSDRERDYVAAVLTSMVGRTERVLKRADFVLLGNNTDSAEELAELREQHGTFMVLMRSIDRTEQLELIDGEITRIVTDLQSLVVFLTNLQNNRTNESVQRTEALRRLLSGN